MRILYITDIHGNGSRVTQVLKLAEKKDVKAVIIGGDICPAADIIRQRVFLESIILSRIEEFRKKHKKDVFIMMGNDDHKINMDALERAERAGIVKLLDQNVHKLNDISVAGYSPIAPTPFHFKGWERPEEEIARDLASLKKKCRPRKTIFVFHAPPFNTALDTLYSGGHAGSTAVREFIQKAQPLISLHGHIHESPDMSGKWMIKIGKTVSINPGPFKIVSFTTDLKEIKLL